MHDIFQYEFHPAQLILKPLLLLSLLATLLSNAIFSDFSLYFQPTIVHGGWIPLFATRASLLARLLQYILGVLGLYIRAFLLFYAATLSIIRILPVFSQGIAAIKSRFSLKQMLETPYPFLGNLAILTVMSLLLFVVYGTERAFYLATLELPLLCLGIIFLSAGTDYCIQRKFVRRALIVLIILAAMNCVFLAYKYSAFVTHPVSEVPIYGKRDILVSSFDPKADKAAIDEAYAACNLPELKKASHLVLDDFTYSALKSTPQPFNLSYITGTFHYGIEKFDINAFLEVMDRYHSDGMFVNCEQVPDSLWPFVTMHGDFCCMHYPVK